MSRKERQKKRKEKREALKQDPKHIRNIKRAVEILKFALLIFIVVGLPVYLIVFRQDLWQSFKSPQDVRDFIDIYHGKSFLIMLAAQIVQIVIAVLPGQAVEFATGFMFPFWEGLIIMVLGSLIGSAICYWLARILGANMINFLFGEGKVGKVLQKIESKKGYLGIFIIYLIPGVPKDVLNYVAGLTDMEFLPFLIMSNAARIPAVSVTLLVGTHTFNGEWTLVAILIGAVLVLCLVGYIFRNRISDIFDKFYYKTSRK